MYFDFKQYMNLVIILYVLYFSQLVCIEMPCQGNRNQNLCCRRDCQNIALFAFI